LVEYLSVTEMETHLLEPELRLMSLVACCGKVALPPGLMHEERRELYL
jgi:hypothetical protein